MWPISVACPRRLRIPLSLAATDFIYSDSSRQNLPRTPGKLPGVAVPALFPPRGRSAWRRLSDGRGELAAAGADTVRRDRALTAPIRGAGSSIVLTA